MSRILAALRGLGWRTLLSHAVGIVCAVALTAAAWLLRDSGWESVREHPYFAIKEVTVRGTGDLLERGAVLRWLDIGDSASSWDASPYRWRRRLEAHPMIAHAEVHREFPGRYEITVRERQPQAIVLLDEPFYVDRAGNAFGPLGHAHRLDYPVITGVDDEMPPGYRRWLLRRGLRLARLCERIGCFGGVSEISLHPELGAILYPIVPAVPIVMGWGSWAEKIGRATRALDQWQGREAGLASVDVRFREQVVVRLSKPSSPGSAAGMRAERAPGRRDAAPRRPPNANDGGEQPSPGRRGMRV
jgi:cell division protein FtsQ